MNNLLEITKLSATTDEIRATIQQAYRAFIIRNEQTLITEINNILRGGGEENEKQIWAISGII